MTKAADRADLSVIAYVNRKKGILFQVVKGSQKNVNCTQHKYFLNFCDQKV